MKKEKEVNYKVKVNKKIGICIVVVAIVVASMFVECVDLPVNLNDPCAVVEYFAKQHKKENFNNCYFLMSEKYKTSINFDEDTFSDEMEKCQAKLPAGFYYELYNIKPENISDNSALIKYTYYEKSPIISFGEPRTYTKEIKLVKEDDGWKLDELHCELIA